METLRFVVYIDAPKDEVWSVMLDPNTYQEWTASFAEGSYYEGSWDEGETIRFLTPQRRGMLAVIAEKKPYEYISIKHVGIVKDGIEDTESPEVKAWAPAYENYTFVEENGVTELRVDVEVTPEEKNQAGRLWPRALARLKLICEES